MSVREEQIPYEGLTPNVSFIFSNKSSYGILISADLKQNQQKKQDDPFYALL